MSICAQIRGKTRHTALIFVGKCKVKDETNDGRDTGTVGYISLSVIDFLQH